MTTILKEEASLSTSYQRGVELAKRGKVGTTKAYWCDDGEVQLKARVNGSTGSYDVTVELNPEEREVVSYNCTCPAHRKYFGMCKHAIAVALNFSYVYRFSNVQIPRPADIVEVFEPLVKSDRLDVVTAPSAPKPSPKPKPRPKPLPPTSPQVSAIISGYAEQTRREVQIDTPPSSDRGEAVAAPVSLECVLQDRWSITRGTRVTYLWSLGLKVCRGKSSYVVKSIEDLIFAWENSSFYSYGKNLAFRHSPSAFTPSANQLIERLRGIVRAQRCYFDTYEDRGSYYYRNGMNSKEISLDNGQLTEILSGLEGEHITLESTYYQSYGGYRRQRTTLVIRNANPRPTVRLEHAEDIWRLSVEPRSLACVSDDRETIMWDDDSLYLCDAKFSHDLGPFFAAVLPIRDPLNVRDADMGNLVATIAPVLSEHVNLEMPAEATELMPPQAEFVFHVSLEEGRIVCRATVSYGTTTLPLYANVYKDQPARDVRREMLVQQLVRAFFPLGDHRTPNYGIPHEGSTPSNGGGRWDSYLLPSNQRGDPWFDRYDDEAYYLLFTEGLDALRQIGEVYLSERLRNVTVRQSPSVNIEASVSGGLLDLVVSSDDMSPSELMEYLSSYRIRQKFVRLENGDIVELDGPVAIVDELADGLGITAEQLVEGTGGLPSNRTLFVDAMLKRAEGVSFSRDTGFRKIVRDFETIADADFVVPASISAKLRPYQEDGFRWLCTLGGVGFGGILADDMGLGKTLQAISYLVHARDEGAELPALVVCPASLVYNWASEFERFAPDMEVSVVAGGKRERVSAIAASPDSNVLVTSYDLMKRDIDAYDEQSFSCVILDEAQYIKNPNTQVARAAKRLEARTRFALTGTPIENRLLELWSIFDFLMPGVLGTRDSFAKRFSSPIGSGDEAAATRLQRLVSPFILRRLKRDVLRDLPEKNESLVTASLAGEQDKLYRASAQRLRMQLEKTLPEEFAGQRIQVLAELTKLRQICCDPHLVFDNYKGGSAKLDTCMELVQTAIAGGHQVLVFSQFTSMLDLIAKRLSAGKVSYLTLTGSTPKEERLRLVARYQAGEAPVFLISLKAGGVGLNLTAADIVIHFDPWWNVAAEDQATDRTHRIGQTREVSVFKLIAKDTVEEKIVAMQQAKRALADAVIGGEGVSSSVITRDDILALLDS